MGSHSPDLVVVGRVSTCRKAQNILEGIPIVFVSSTNTSRDTAFDIGCIDFILESELGDLMSKLLTYARMGEMRKTLEKLLAKSL